MQRRLARTKSRQAGQQGFKGSPASNSFRNRIGILCGLLFAVVSGGFALFKLGPGHPVASQTVLASAPATTNQLRRPTTLTELLALSPDQLEHCDIALMNLLCAERLVGSEDLDVQGCLRLLDGLAQTIERETKRHQYRFQEHPEQFRNSLAYYCMMMLGSVLAEDLGIRYNPKIALPQFDGRVPTLGDVANSKDVFIHGLLSANHYGTCASMPVLYVAVARRLGYPVNLAATKYHLYVRYEGENGGHLNVEPTMTDGFLTPPDADYKMGNSPAQRKRYRGMAGFDR